MALLVAAALAAAPALAGDISFNGRTLTVSDQDDEIILKMTSSNYALNKTREDLVSAARTCLSGKPGLVLGAVDADTGLVEATHSVEYRARFSNYQVRSKLILSTEDRLFWITDTNIEVAQTNAEETQPFVPLSKQNSGWDKGLILFIQNENQLVDCLFK